MSEDYLHKLFINEVKGALNRSFSSDSLKIDVLPDRDVTFEGPNENGLYFLAMEAPPFSLDVGKTYSVYIDDVAYPNLSCVEVEMDTTAAAIGNLELLTTGTVGNTDVPFVVVNGTEGGQPIVLFGLKTASANHRIRICNDTTLGSVLDDINGEVIDDSGSPAEPSIPAGLYTDNTYSTMTASWQELLDAGTVHVDNGVVYTSADLDAGENSSSEALTGVLVLPDDGSVTSIGNYLYDETVYVPEYDEYGAYVGNIAFACCTELTGVVIPDTVTTISCYAFVGCTSLTSIEIPDSVTFIGGFAFCACASLTSIDISDSVTNIGDYAFRECTSMTSIDIPDSVTNIGDWAFYGCTSMTSMIVMAEVPPTLDSTALTKCAALTEIKVPASSVDAYKTASGWSEHAGIIIAK